MHHTYTNATAIPQVVYDRFGNAVTVAPGATFTEDYFTPDSGLFGLVVGVPALDDDDRAVATVDMKVGDYAIANASPVDSLARNITVTHATQGGTADTLGTITIEGTDIEGKAISEQIVPSADGVATGAKAFKTVTKVTGAGWVIDAGGTPEADHIKVGFGNLIGLPVKIAEEDRIVQVALGTALINAPVVAHGAAICQCTVDASGGTYDGTKKLVVLLKQ